MLLSASWIRIRRDLSAKVENEKVIYVQLAPAPRKSTWYTLISTISVAVGFHAIRGWLIWLFLCPGCSTCYLMKVSRQASKLLVNCGWLGGEMSPAKLTMEFLRTEKLFSKIKTKLRSLRIWAQLTLSFSNLCPTSSHHQYSLRSNILARLTIGLAGSHLCRP